MGEVCSIGVRVTQCQIERFKALDATILQHQIERFTASDIIIIIYRRSS